MIDWAQFRANQDAIDLLAAAAVVAGLSTCLFGLRLWRFVLGAVGLIVGGIGAAQFAAMHANDRVIVIAGLGLCTGCVMMIVLATLYRFGTLIAFSLIGWYVGMRIGQQMNIDGADLIACSFGGALVLGVISILIEMPVVMVLSALAGAWIAVWGASLYFGHGFAFETDAYALLVKRSQYESQLLALVVLAGVGLALQVLGWWRAGPDMKEIRQAVDHADLPKKRRVAILESLRDDSSITRSEYYRHMIRILSGS